MRILELTLEAPDPGAQAAFWAQTLGMPVTERDGAAEVRLARSAIRFVRSAAGTQPRYHFAINIPAGAIQEAEAWLAERVDVLAFHDDPDVPEGGTIMRTPTGLAAIYFLDAAGNVVELLSHDRQDIGADGAFGPAWLLEIGEIGVATADTAGTRRAIQDALGAGVLWGGGEGSLLTAIGDIHGVVIVAPTGRGWIPIGLPAEPLPTAIVAEGRREHAVTLPEGPYRIRTVVR